MKFTFVSEELKTITFQRVKYIFHSKGLLQKLSSVENVVFPSVRKEQVNFKPKPITFFLEVKGRLSVINTSASPFFVHRKR